MCKCLTMDLGDCRCRVSSELVRATRRLWRASPSPPFAFAEAELSWRTGALEEMAPPSFASTGLLVAPEEAQREVFGAAPGFKRANDEWQLGQNASMRRVSPGNERPTVNPWICPLGAKSREFEQPLVPCLLADACEVCCKGLKELSAPWTLDPL
jgi:hypothetical protein